MNLKQLAQIATRGLAELKPEIPVVIDVGHGPYLEVRRVYAYSDGKTFIFEAARAPKKKPHSKHLPETQTMFDIWDQAVL